MLVAGISSRRLLRCSRINSSLRAARIAQSSQYFRWKSTSSQPIPKQTQAQGQTRGAKKSALRERVILYHAGTGRSVFIGCLKVTTILVFGLFTFVMVPTHLRSEEEPVWVAPGVFLSGLAPLLLVAYITSPFVANVHLRLPHYVQVAGKSQEMVMRYSQNLPKDAKLEITKMNFIGLPRRTIVKIEDLKSTKQRFGMINYIRDVKASEHRKEKAIDKFGIYGGSKLPSVNTQVWNNILKTVKTQSVLM